jgi:hypothetical protein
MMALLGFEGKKSLYSGKKQGIILEKGDFSRSGMRSLCCFYKTSASKPIKREYDVYDSLI